MVVQEKNDASTCIRGMSGATGAPNTLSMTSCTSCWICALGLALSGSFLGSVDGADDVAWSLLWADRRAGASFGAAL